MSQTSFICAAVNYKPDSTNNCELLTENDKTATEETAIDGWSYHIRPLCAGRFSILAIMCNNITLPKIGRIEAEII